MVREGHYIGQVLPGELDLMADFMLLHGDHRHGPPPHLAKELEGIHHRLHRRRAQLGRVGAADAVDRVARHAALAGEQVLTPVRIHGEHDQAGGDSGHFTAGARVGFAGLQPKVGKYGGGWGYRECES